MFLTAAIEKVRRMVGKSATWQAATGLGETAATERVKLTATPARLPRPYASVSLLDPFGFRRIAGGSRDFHRPFATLELYLQMEHPQGLSDDEAKLATAEFAAGILTDVVALAGQDDSGQDGSFPAIERAWFPAWFQSKKEHQNSMGLFWHGSAVLMLDD